MSHLNRSVRLAAVLLLWSATPGCVEGSEVLLTSGAATLLTAPFGTSTYYFVKQSDKREAYLRHNHRAIQQDLARGAGPTIDDLAQMFAVHPVDRARFGRRLRARRSELSPLLERGAIDTDRAQLFYHHVYLAAQR